MRTSVTGVSAVAFCALGLMAGSAHAAFTNGLVDVQFKAGGNTQTGAAVTGAVGDTWNTDSNGAAETGLPLNSVSGAATGITLSYVNQSSNYNLGGTVPLLGQYLYNSTNDATKRSVVTLTGLDASSVYNLYVYSSANADGRTSLFTVDGLTTDEATTSLVYNGGAVGGAPATSYASGNNYFEFTNLAPSAAGTLNINFGPSPANLTEADFNGFQLAVPEPMSAGLLAIGSLGLLARRRRR